MKNDKLSDANLAAMADCKGNLCSQQKIDADMANDDSNTKLQMEKSAKLAQCKGCIISDSDSMAKENMKVKEDFEQGVFQTKNFGKLHQ